MKQIPLTEAEVLELLAAGEVMTSAEVAAMLRVSRVTVRTMVNRGVLQPLRPGTRPLLFDGRAVRQLEGERLTEKQLQQYAELRRLWDSS